MATHAETMVTKIEALLEGRADSDIAQYTIGGRSITKLSPEELIKWRSFYKAEVQQEQAAADIAAGTGNPNKVKVRF